MHEPQTKNPLRCFCSRHPLMAYYGLDKDGELYVHTKVFKQSRIYSEIVFSSGTVKIRCRECLRWHRIIFSASEARLEESTEPDVA